MYPPKYTEKQKSEMIMRIYFPELFPDSNIVPQTFGLPKEFADRMNKIAEDFIKLN